MRTKTIGLCCCCLLAATVFGADPAPAAANTRAGIDQQLASLSQRQVELAFTLRDQLQKNETLWLDPRYTSPEIEKLRVRMKLVEKEMQELQTAIRALVAEVPEAKAEIAKVEKGKAEHQTLARRIEELKKRREQLP